MQLNSQIRSFKARTAQYIELFERFVGFTLANFMYIVYRRHSNCEIDTTEIYNKWMEFKAIQENGIFQQMVYENRDILEWNKRKGGYRAEIFISKQRYFIQVRCPRANDNIFRLTIGRPKKDPFIWFQDSGKNHAYCMLIYKYAQEKVNKKRKKEKAWTLLSTVINAYDTSISLNNMSESLDKWLKEKDGNPIEWPPFFNRPLETCHNCLNKQPEETMNFDDTVKHNADIAKKIEEVQQFEAKERELKYIMGLIANGKIIIGVADYSNPDKIGEYEILEFLIPDIKEISRQAVQSMINQGHREITSLRAEITTPVEIAPKQDPNILDILSKDEIKAVLTAINPENNSGVMLERAYFKLKEQE